MTEEMDDNLRRLVQVRNVRSVHFDADGQKVAFLTDITGEYELWCVAEPRTPPRQLTFRGGVRPGSWDTDDGWLSYEAPGSEGGQQLFAVDPDSGATRQLTDEAGVVHNWGQWASDGFLCTANGRDSSTFDVVHVTESARTRLYEHRHDSRVTPVGWEPSAGELLVHETHANGHQGLAVVDTETGSLTRLTDGSNERQSRLRSLQPAPDDDAVYAVTEHDRDRRGIYRVSLDDGTTEPVVTADANLKSLSVHPETGRLVYERERDGQSTLQTGVFDGETTVDPLPTPEFAAGYFGPVTVDPTGRRGAVVYYDGVQPPQIHTVELETGETTQWTELTDPSVGENPPEPESVWYESVGGVDVHAFYTEPSTTASVPAVVYLHPGPTQQVRDTFNPVRRYFLEEGYAYFEPNYRGSSGYGRTYRRLDHGEGRFDAIEDVGRAVEWLADRPAVDADRIAVFGHSYGGFLALSTAVQFSVGAAAALAPITNFEAVLEDTAPWWRANREAEYGSLTEDRELLRRLSPVHSLDRVDCPLLFVHGLDDATVPPTQSKEAIETADEHDIDVEFEFLENAGHGFTANDDRVAAFGRVASFFDRHLGR